MYSFAVANPDVGITSCRTLYSNGKREREIAFLSPWLTIGWLRSIYKLAFSIKIAKKFPENKKYLVSRMGCRLSSFNTKRFFQ